MNSSFDFNATEKTLQAADRGYPTGADLRAVKRSRYLGCLLGGGVGDALGYPVEFLRENDRTSCLRFR